MENNQVQIVFLGGSTLDRVWNVDKLPSGGFKSKAHTYFEVGGGMAANAAVASSRLGAKTHFWGRGGNDDIGMAMKYQLEQYEVNCQFFKLIDGAKSPVSAVIVDDNGERMIINYPGTMHSQNCAWLPFYILNKISAVQSDTRWLEGAKSLFEHAIALKIPTILDAEKSPTDSFLQILPLTDYAIFSATGLSNFAQGINLYNLTTIELLQKLAKDYNCRVVAVTNGDKGITWIENQEIFTQSSYKVKVVDTTGAGDVFHGAFTYGIANRYSTAKSMQIASAAAAIKCTHMGGRGGVPDLEEVLEFIDKNSL